jgi:hypothetical protein
VAVGESSRIKRRCFIAMAVECVRSQRLPSPYYPSESDPASHGGLRKSARLSARCPPPPVGMYPSPRPPYPTARRCHCATSSPPSDGNQRGRRSLLTVVAVQTHMTGILISHDLSLPTLFLSRLFLSALAVVLSTPVELVPFAWLDDQSTPATQGCIPRA